MLTVSISCSLSSVRATVSIASRPRGARWLQDLPDDLFSTQAEQKAMLLFGKIPRKSWTSLGLDKLSDVLTAEAVTVDSVH